MSALRILIVEDEPKLSVGFANFLRRRLDVSCDIVDTAEAAVQILTSTAEPYDAVTSDWNLAGALTGEAVFNAMKSLGLEKKLVFITSEYDLALELDPTLAVAAKPVKLDDLYKLVRAAIDARPVP